MVDVQMLIIYAVPALRYGAYCKYDNKKSIMVANIVKQEWLARYPRPYLITLD